MTLTEFATIIQVEIQITWNLTRQIWIAGLKCDTKEAAGDKFIRGYTGEGSNPGDALSRLASNLKGKIVLVKQVDSYFEFGIPNWIQEEASDANP